MAADDEGAIDTNDEAQQYQYPEYGAGPSPPQGDESGAAPVAAAPDDNSGAAPAAPAEAGAIDTGEDGQPRTGPNGPIARGLKHGYQAVVSYLMGAGAAHPDVLDQTAAQVDPQGSMSSGDRNIMAVDKAAQDGGPKAAWQLVQANRVAYNAKQAFAYAALNGTQQKPADLNAAIQAANQAGDHILDGSDVNFAPSQGGGVTATVTAPGQTQPQVFNLNPDQFREYLNVGRTGQWDRMMQDGIPATLQKIAAHRPGQASPNGRLQQQAPQQAPQAQQQAPQPRKQINFGNTPSTMNLSGNQDPIPESDQQPDSTYTPEQEQRSRAQFPWASQEGQRQGAMQADSQRQAALDNAVEVATEKGKLANERARITGAGRVEQEGVKQAGNEKVANIKVSGWKYASDAKQAAAQITADQKTAAAGDKAAQQRITEARRALQSKQATGNTLTPDDLKLDQMLNQQGRQAIERQNARPAATQPQAPQQAPAPQQQAPVKDPAAMKWLQENPNDPRAAAVRQKLGL